MHLVLNFVSYFAIPVILVSFWPNMATRLDYTFFMPTKLLWLVFCFVWVIPPWYLCVKLGGSSAQREATIHAYRKNFLANSDTNNKGAWLLKQFAHRLSRGFSCYTATYSFTYFTFLNRVIVPHKFSQRIQESSESCHIQPPDILLGKRSIHH